MRSKTMAIMAAAVLFLPTVAHAQPSEERGWTFAVLTIWQYSGQSNIKRVPYGVFTSQDVCDVARAKKIVELDDINLRLPHKTRDSETQIIHLPDGSMTEKKVGPTEIMHVTDCTAEKFSYVGGDISLARSQTAQKN